MRRSTAKVKQLAGAVGLILALPFSFAAAASADAHASSAAALTQLAEASSVLDAWRDYALADITPSFSWADTHADFAPPSLFDRGNGRFKPPASRFAGSVVEPSPIQIAYMKAKVADTPLFIAADSSNLLQQYVPGLQRYIIAPSITRRWGERSTVSVSAIFAYQRFAGIGMGIDSVPVQGTTLTSTAPIQPRDNTGTSYGTGMRVDFDSALTDRLSWQIGYQTRVNMQAFDSYRGVYLEPGSFDIPATANFGIGYAFTPEFKLDLGVERVMYSQITPFVSNALPDRLLVLLSSEISPVFAWQDLNVYSIGWSLLDDSSGLWTLRYSTREQPMPTSPLLQIALAPYMSSHDIEFAFSHPFGAASNLRFAATYAPTQFLLGGPTSYSLRNNFGSSQLEYEALWTTRF